MKKKYHVIKEHKCIPPFTSEAHLDTFNSFFPVILKMTAWKSLGPLWIFVCILDETIEVSSSDNLAFKPPLSFMWKVECFSNGAL